MQFIALPLRISETFFAGFLAFFFVGGATQRAIFCLSSPLTKRSLLHFNIRRFLSFFSLLISALPFFCCCELLAPFPFSLSVSSSFSPKSRQGQLIFTQRRGSCNIFRRPLKGDKKSTLTLIGTHNASFFKALKKLKVVLQCSKKSLCVTFLQDRSYTIYKSEFFSHTQRK